MNKEIKRELAYLKELILAQVVHQLCARCGKVGHEKDMTIHFREYARSAQFYHEDCYAIEFNCHKCECGCGKWIENEPVKARKP